MLLKTYGDNYLLKDLDGIYMDVGIWTQPDINSHEDADSKHFYKFTKFLPPHPSAGWQFPQLYYYTEKG